MSEIAARRVLQTPVGKLAITSSEVALTSLEFLSSKSSLKDFSSSPYAKSLVDEAAKQLEEYFQGKRKQFDLKLAPTGTKFQQQVWQQIQKIPFGKTISYGAIAKAVKNPSAARAVGGAVGANPLAILIPCHRVMGATGKLTGYSGGSGIPTKKKLLAIEGIEFR
jgi:methylated-DNA-[protein]-cysteine S-methyltransferase